ncbi:MAG: long-chain fatty acid--CoA ligase [Burkholderiales bacterium]|nr:long-chain fatty acid--CoA ligase [Burkholderiales bacterium]
MTQAEAQYLARPWTRHYPRGVPETLEVPPRSVVQVFDEACARDPKRAALVFHGRRIAYGELREAADRLACALARLGVRKGDRVALYLVNSPQFVIAYFAVLKCGAVVTPISPVYTSHEVRHQLADSGARVVVCQDLLYDKVERCGVPLEAVVLTSLGEYLPAMQRLFAKGPLARLFGERPAAPLAIPPAPHLHWLQDLLAANPPEPPAVEIDPKRDLAALPYTGGTTGNPKGVMLTHYNVAAALAGVRALFPDIEPGKETVIAFLPFFHIYGQVAIMLNGLAQGNLLVLFTTPDTEAILDAIERYRATVFYGVPTLYEYLKDHKDTAKVDWRRLKLILSGADTLHESTMKAWAERTGSRITEGYGLTETCALAHVNPIHRPKTGSFGCPAPNVWAAVADPETLEFVPPGEVGELVLDGPNVMQGYWNRPEENARVFFERAGHRWLRTGDLVRMDEEGYFHFFDRAKDLIKYKGYSVFARDVEDVLYAHPEVKAAGVIGVPDPAVGQRIKAIVVLQNDARGRVGEEDIKAWCRERLAEYKVPHIVEFRGELPKTDVGKVSRRELREEAA